MKASPHAEDVNIAPLLSPELKNFDSIQLGDAKSRVMEFFGQPQSKKTENDGGQSWTYDFNEGRAISQIRFFFGAGKSPDSVDTKVLVPNFNRQLPTIRDLTNNLELLKVPRCERHYDLSEGYMIDRTKNEIVGYHQSTGEIKSISFQTPDLFAKTIQSLVSCPEKKSR